MKRSHTVICALLTTVLSSATLSTTALAAASSSQKWNDNSGFHDVKSKIHDQHYNDAIIDLKRMLKNDRHNADIYNLLGYTHRKLKKYELAEGYYERALTLNPDHKGAMEYLGELYVETGRMTEAKQMLSRLDKACLFSCKEYKQLETYIQQKKQGMQTQSKW